MSLILKMVAMDLLANALLHFFGTKLLPRWIPEEVSRSFALHTFALRTGSMSASLIPSWPLIPFISWCIFNHAKLWKTAWIQQFSDAVLQPLHAPPWL
jgi:hypothetical protein